MAKHKVIPSLHPLLTKVSGLKEDPKNHRSHPKRNLRVIEESLKKFGQRRPILVNERTGFVEAGSGTLRGIKKLKWDLCAVATVDDDPEMAEAYGLVDNRSAELAEWDDTVDAAVLGLGDEGWDIEDMGWRKEELTEPVADPGDNGAVVPEVPKKQKTKPGDVFMLGQHRIVCVSRKGPLTVEMSPAHCDAVVKRWEEHTGKKAKRNSKKRPSKKKAGKKAAKKKTQSKGKTK